MHAFVARLPQTSQSCSAAAKRGGSTDDAADAEAGAAAADAEGGDADDEMVLARGRADSTDAEAEADVDADVDAAGLGDGGVGNDRSVEVDGPAVALGCFPPFFFVMGWYVGILEVRRA